MQHFGGTTRSFIWLATLAVGRDGNDVGEISKVQVIKGPEGCLGLYPTDNVKSLKDLEQGDDVSRFTQ